MSDYWGGRPELDDRDRALIAERVIARRELEEAEPCLIEG